MAPTLTIAEARWPDDTAVVRALFAEYIASLDFDVGFQGAQAELANLPGRYARPDGAVFLARDGEANVAVVAFRRFDARSCEMKRMYVRPGHRGLHLGERLARRVVEEASAAGYARMLLDTIDTMAPAIALYRRLGFVEIPAYYDSPLPGATYMALALAPDGSCDGDQAAGSLPEVI